MSNFEGNLLAWKNLIEIDYYTYFVKAWITFNSWYRINYKTLDSERACINEIKSTSNPFRDRLLYLLKTNDENYGIKNYIGRLHRELEEHSIFQKDINKNLSFSNIGAKNKDADNKIITESIRGYKYYLKNNKGTIELIFSNPKKKKTIINKKYSGYDIESFKNDLSSNASITNNQKVNLQNFFEEFNPIKEISLLHPNPNAKDVNEKNKEPNYIECERYFFINELEEIVVGLIEVIYRLRNALFHGEVIPDKKHMKIYENAYHILKIVLDYIV